MRPGLMRDMVDIEKDVSADGTPIPDYSGADLWKSVPCDIVPTGGDETYKGRQLEARTAYVVTLQYIDGVLPNMRLRVTGGLYAGRLLNIANVRPIDVARGQTRKLELYCDEVVAL